MAGNKVEILPSRVFLTLGIRDVLLLKNLDDVPQIFGPTLMMPGQSFRLPFEVASSYQFACTAHASGQMTVVVDEQPDTALAAARVENTKNFQGRCVNEHESKRACRRWPSSQCCWLRGG